MSVKMMLSVSCATFALIASNPALAQQGTASAAAQAGATQAVDDQETGTAETGPDGKPVRGKVRVEERDGIVVTGSRFQKLLDQPQPKAIISAEDRNLAGVNTATELVRSQPGFNITADFGINVRGIGRQTAQTLLGQENTVTQYVDGFLNIVPANIGESTLFGGNLTFIRGPSGTNYGRNAIAGAINVISRAPTPDYTAQVVFGTARANAFNFGANVSGPITDNLGFRVGMQEFIQPSVSRAVGGVSGAGFAVKNSYIEFQLEWRVGDFHIRNRATTFEYDNQPAYPTLSRYNNNLNGNVSPVFGGLSPNPARGFTGAVPDQPFTTNVNFVGYDKLRDNFQDILNADLDLGFAQLYYVGGYQTYRAFGSADRDLTSRTSYDANTVAPGNFAPGTQVPTDYRSNYDNDVHYSTHEGRLESKPGGAVNWILGVYRLSQHFDEQYWENIENATAAILTPIVGTPGLTLAPNPRRSEYEQRNIYDIRSTAVFGNVTWDIAPTLRIDAGLRQTWDEKDALSNFRYVFYYPPSFAGDFSPLVHGARTFRKDDGLSGRAALAWRPGPGDQLYVSYARGYQSSAFTLGQGLPPNNVAKKEFLDVYEIGGNWTEGRLRFDGSIFYQIFHDQQIPISTRGVFTGPGGVPAPGPIFTQFANAKRTEIYGLEAQLSWRPNDQSNIVASYTYLHGQFKDFCPQPTGSTSCGVVDISEPATINGVANPLSGALQNLSGNEQPRAPHSKATLYGYYGIDLGDFGHLYPGGSVYYQSSFYTSPFTRARFRVPGRTIANATLTYRTANDRLDITGVVSNVFRTRYADSSVLSTFGSGSVSQAVFYGADRTWSLTARYRF
ncbi:MAG TPA: TonB-dependent receptor [Novosphingobium sp.]|nr:TonB-dependent receptor [Novosphingobium sp.]